MLLTPLQQKLFDYCQQNGRGLLSPFEIKFIDRINEQRTRWRYRQVSLTPGQAKLASGIAEKLDTKTNGRFHLWSLPKSHTRVQKP